MKNLIGSLVAAGALIASTAAAGELPHDTTIQPPPGPSGQATRLVWVDTVATSVDLNGTIYGQVEYVGIYGSGRNAGYCAGIYATVWDVTGTLVSTAKTSNGCAPGLQGVFAPIDNQHYYRPISPTVYSQYATWGTRSYWKAFTH